MRDIPNHRLTQTPHNDSTLRARAQTSESSEIEPGVLVDIEVTIKNLGDQMESFDVTCYYDSEVVGTKRVEDLAAGDSVILTFTWDTNGVPFNEYQITAWADSGEELTEINEENNWCTMILPIFVIPELPLGTVTALITTFAAMLIYSRRKILNIRI